MNPPTWASKGVHVRVTRGPYENLEGEIDEILPGKNRVRVVLVVFGRATLIELEYWQVEKA